MTPKTKAHEIELERTLHAPAGKVWDALTKRSELSRWYAPTDDFRTEVLEWDLRVGGTFRIAMHAPDGKTHTCFGVFREITPGRRLSYTWSWEGQDPMDSIVAFDLSEKGGQTILRLTHTGLPSEEARAHHERGWVGIAGRLEALWAA
ncbi:MAG: SRPBCC domain-containing protein [Gemmatimonadota bacterium]